MKKLFKQFKKVAILAIGLLLIGLGWLFRPEPPFGGLTTLSGSTDTGTKYEIVIDETIPNEKQGKVEIIKSRPEMRFQKWDGEVDMGVTYGKLGNKVSTIEGDKVMWKDAKEEVHAYQVDENNFEIDIILKEKPVTNVFEFQIDGAEDLNFFYQPALTQ